MNSHLMLFPFHFHYDFEHFSFNLQVALSLTLHSNRNHSKILDFSTDMGGSWLSITSKICLILAVFL